MSEGEYRITVEALCDGKTLTEDEYTLMVKRSDGDPPHNNGKDGEPKVNALTIVIIASIIIIAIISAAAVLFLLNRKKGTEVPETVEMELDS